MDAEPYATVTRPEIPDARRTPFAQVSVTLTQQEYIQLVWDARYWKTAHRRALARLEQLIVDHQRAMAQAALRERALQSELETAQAKIRDLQKRLFGQKSEHSTPDPNPSLTACFKNSYEQNGCGRNNSHVALHMPSGSMDSLNRRAFWSLLGGRPVPARHRSPWAWARAWSSCGYAASCRLFSESGRSRAAARTVCRAGCAS